MFDLSIQRKPFVPDKVYYHKGVNRFFQTKRITDDYIEISGLCEYYSDAMTNLQRSRVSYKFVKNAQIANNIDKIAVYDEIGWRVRKKDEK